MTTATNKPNLIILRIPRLDEHPHASFVSAALDEDGNITDDPNEIETFSVHDGDAYLNMTFNQVVFAQSIEIGSMDLGWFTVADNDENPIVVHEMQPYELQDFVHYVWANHNFDPPVASH